MSLILYNGEKTQKGHIIIDNTYAFIIMCGCVLFMIIRHKKNIVRLFRGTESKIYILGKKKGPTLDRADKK